MQVITRIDGFMMRQLSIETSLQYNSLIGKSFALMYITKGCTRQRAYVGDTGLDALVGDIKVVTPAARRALLRALQRRPAEAAVLWLSCAHVAAWQRVPDSVLDRYYCKGLYRSRVL